MKIKITRQFVIYIGLVSALCAVSIGAWQISQELRWRSAYKEYIMGRAKNARGEFVSGRGANAEVRNLPMPKEKVAYCRTANGKEFQIRDFQSNSACSVMRGSVVEYQFNPEGKLVQVSGPDAQSAAVSKIANDRN